MFRERKQMAKDAFALDKVAIRMIKEPPLYSEHPINGPEAVVKLMADTLAEYDREVFAIINLRPDLKPINVNIVSMGALDQSLVHPREAIKSMVLSNAASVMMVHNHTTGSMSPSAQDISVTDRMAKLCELLGIKLIDHIIVGPGKDYYSFHEKGVLPLPQINYETSTIRSFKPENYYTIQLKCDGVTLAGERIPLKDQADSWAEDCRNEGMVQITKAEKKEKQEKAPALFDLTNLQREANRRLGYTAQQTLDYTQSLYEKKLVSYPRTDSRFLTEDMEANLPALVSKVQTVFSISATEGRNYKAVINGKKVTDHHAIIPTASVDKVDTSELPTGEREVLRLIAIRLLEAASAPCSYAETVIET